MRASGARSIVDGVYTFDRDMRYTSWNGAMEKLTGKRAEDVVGKWAFDVFPFLLTIGQDKLWARVLDGEAVVAPPRPFTIPETLRRGTFVATYEPVRDARGNVVGGRAVVKPVP